MKEIKRVVNENNLLSEEELTLLNKNFLDLLSNQLNAEMYYIVYQYAEINKQLKESYLERFIELKFRTPERSYTIALPDSNKKIDLEYLLKIIKTWKERGKLINSNKDLLLKLEKIKFYNKLDNKFPVKNTTEKRGKI